MSASATRTARSGSNEGSRQSEPFGLRIFFLFVSLSVSLTLLVGLSTHWARLKTSLPMITLWVAVAAVGDLLPINFWGTVTLSVSLPVTLAAGMVLPPVEAALIAFVAALDLREFRGEVGFARGLYNRSQVAACVLLASITFHALGGSPNDWPNVLFAGVLALAVDCAANVLLVMVPTAIMTHLSVKDVWLRVADDSPLDHSLGYLCLGLLAVLLATVFVHAGEWGLVSFILPLVLARQMFVRGHQLSERAHQIEAKDQALLEGAEQVLLERRDERMVVAGELHDEVLPPLFKVHLMGQVLRKDLDSGRLLDLDDDIPELLAATELAQAAVRGLVSDLRRSPLGPGGLNPTVRLLVRQLESAGSPPIVIDLEEVGGSSVVQLLAYQVVREALNNAARHSRAGRIQLRMFRDEGLIRILIEDDGVGFDPSQVDRDSHFGLQLISERVEAARGRMVIDTQLGAGTRIVATLPPEIS